MPSRRDHSDDAWFAATAGLVLVAIVLATILLAAVELRWGDSALDTAILQQQRSDEASPETNKGVTLHRRASHHATP
jgi:hypothetical protein